MATISRTSTSPVTSKPVTTPTSTTPKKAEVCTPDDPTGAHLRDGFDDAPATGLSGALLTGTTERTSTPDSNSVTAKGALASVTATGRPGTVTASLGAVSAKAERETEGVRLDASAEASVSALQLEGTTTVAGTPVTSTTTVGTVGLAAEAETNAGSLSGSLAGTVTTASTSLEVTHDPSSTTTASLSGPSLEYGVEASGTLTSSGVDVKVELSIDATLAEANVSHTKTIPVEIGGEPYEVEVNLEALGKVSAEGTLELELHVGPDGVSGKAEVDGFAGAQASLTGGIKLKHEGDLVAEGELELSAWTGTPRAPGAGFEADYENGVASLSFEASNGGVAGLGLSVEAKVDAAEAGEAAYDTLTGPLRDAFTPVSNEEQQRNMDELLEGSGVTYAYGA